MIIAYTNFGRELQLPVLLIGWTQDPSQNITEVCKWAMWHWMTLTLKIRNQDFQQVNRWRFNMTGIQIRQVSWRFFNMFTQSYVPKRQITKIMAKLRGAIQGGNNISNLVKPKKSTQDSLCQLACKIIWTNDAQNNWFQFISEGPLSPPEIIECEPSKHFLYLRTLTLLEGTNLCQNVLERKEWNSNRK